MKLEQSILNYKKSQSLEGTHAGSDEDFEVFQKNLDMLVTLLDVETQRRIYDLQQEKDLLIKQMHENIIRIENGEGFPIEQMKDSLSVAYDESTGTLLTLIYNKVSILSEGDLLTDGAWGITYDLPPAVPATLRKEYIVRETRRKILNLYNRQIVDYKTNEAESKTHGAIEIYERIANENKAGISFRYRGIIFEQMVKNMLFKMSRTAGIALTIEDVPISLDIQKGIDFIASIDLNQPFVDQPAASRKKRIAIQLLTSSEGERFEKKKNRIAELDANTETKKNIGIDNACFLSISEKNVEQMSDINFMYQSWRQWGSVPGGPDAAFTTKNKLKIFSMFLDSIGKENRAQTKEIYNRVKEFYND